MSIACKRAVHPKSFLTTNGLAEYDTITHEYSIHCQTWRLAMASLHELCHRHSLRTTQRNIPNQMTFLQLTDKP